MRRKKKLKHIFLDATSVKMVEAWWGSVTQTCQRSAQSHRRSQQNGWSISLRSALSHSQDLHLRFLGTHQSLKAGREDKEWLVNNNMWKGREKRAE